MAAPRACPDQDRPSLEADDTQRATCGPALASPAPTRRPPRGQVLPHGCADGVRAPKIAADRIPQHVAIIMDGNGRWAEQRGRPRPEGHRAGIEAVHDVVHGALEIGLSHLTLYAFSTENWKRDAGEVTRLFAMLDEELRSAPYLDHGVRFRWLGYPDRLPWELVQTLRRNETDSRDQRTLTLTLCVNYGGRAEILHGAAAVARSAWRATSTPNRSQRASSRATSRCPTCPTWTCCGGRAPSSARPTFSPGTPRTPNCSSPPASGQTFTAATCGTPSPNTRDGNAVTARPPADPRPRRDAVTRASRSSTARRQTT